MTATRVAVIGAGPAGVHASDLLICMLGRTYFVDLFDASPAPTSLIPFGSAHRGARSLIDVPRLRLFGNVTAGRDVTVGELTHYYAAVVVAAGESLTVIGNSTEASAVYDALAAASAGVPVSRTPVVVSPEVADQPGAIVALLESRNLPFTTWQGWYRPAWAGTPATSTTPAAKAQGVCSADSPAAKAQGVRSADSSVAQGVVTVAEWSALLSSAIAIPATP